MTIGKKKKKQQSKQKKKENQEEQGKFDKPIIYFVSDRCVLS
jgi:hypothetical protein